MTTRPRRRVPRFLPARAPLRRVFALACVLVALPAPARAHETLQRASPAAGEQLTVAPRELRLTFSAPVDLPLAGVSLTGPRGEVALAPARLHPDSARVLIVPVDGPLVAGTYTVGWRIVGPDGHPIRGEYGFRIGEGAAGLAATSDSVPPPPRPDASGAEPAHHDPETFPGDEGFGVGSPLYVAVRWLTFAGLLGVLGAVAFALLVAPRAAREHGSMDALRADAARRAAGIGAMMAGALVIAALLRLWAQLTAISGGAPAGGMVGAVLMDTVWGWGWILQLGGAAAAIAGFLVARSGRRAGWATAAAAAVVLAFTPALSGHAAATPGIPAVAIGLDALHVVAAGGWIGGLLVLVLAGVPAALTNRDETAGGRADRVAALVRSFSPTALAFAAILVTSGTLSATMHMGSLSALWETGYGRTLVLKLAVFAVVFATGAYNWRRVLPALGQDRATGRLRRSAGVELAAGAIVLLITAVLVATPPPLDTEMEEHAAAAATGPR